MEKCSFGQPDSNDGCDTKPFTEYDMTSFWSY